MAGANTVSSGDTFVKIGWNPIYLEPTTPFRNEMPDFGVEIVCEGDSCNGLPCKIDPDVNGVNEMVGSGGDGAGGAAFCVVTVPKGEKAHVVVFEKNGGGGGQESVTVDVPTSSPTPVSTSSSSTPTPTPTPSSTSSSTSSTPTPSTSSTPTPTPTSSSTSSPVISSVHSPSLSSSSRYPTSSASPSSKLPMTSPSASYTYSPHVFIETGISGAVSSTSTSTPSSPSSSSTSSSSASTVTVPMGFVLSILALVFNQ